MPSVKYYPFVVSLDVPPGIEPQDRYDAVRSIRGRAHYEARYAGQELAHRTCRSTTRASSARLTRETLAGGTVRYTATALLAVSDPVAPRKIPVPAPF